eukprot:5135428-Pleurochrysis_carterae.AAC.2
MRPEHLLALQLALPAARCAKRESRYNACELWTRVLPFELLALGTASGKFRSFLGGKQMGLRFASALTLAQQSSARRGEQIAPPPHEKTQLARVRRRLSLPQLRRKSHVQD